jgi:cold shock CspA family protein
MNNDVQIAAVAEGVVTAWTASGYGFAKIGGREDCFIHAKVTPSGNGLAVGTRVRLTIERGPKGDRALDVEIVDDDSRGNR